MSTTKKLLSIILAILMIVSAMPMAFAAEADVYTHDISKGSIDITPTGYSVGGGDETAFTGRYVITGADKGNAYEINIYDGTEDTVFDITFKNLTIDKSDERYISPVTIKNKGTVNLALEGKNKLYGGKEGCGIALCDSVTLVITDKSTGSLEAIGGSEGAGIGTEVGMETSANIIINGGTVTATGGDGGAGIGTGYNGKMNTIKITGGTVNATAGSDDAESIGKGADGTVNCKFTNYKETVAATCIKNKKISSKCSYCNAVDELEVENTALGHKYDKTDKTNLTRPVQNEDGTWSKGYYTYKCTVDENCTETEKEYVDRADYSGYLEAMERYNTIVDEYSDKFVDSTKDYVIAEVQKIVDKYLGDTAVKNNYVEDEQYILDGIADGVNGICDTLEEGVANGTLIKADYTEINAAIAEIEQKIADNNIADEYTAEFEAIKTELETLRADETATAADINKIMTKLDTYEEKLDAVIADSNSCDACGRVHTNIIYDIFCKITQLFLTLFKLLGKW